MPLIQSRRDGAAALPPSVRIAWTLRGEQPSSPHTIALGCSGKFYGNQINPGVAGMRETAPGA